MSRGSPRAMTIDGNNETGKAASGEAKLHTADLHPEIDLIVRWSMRNRPSPSSAGAMAIPCGGASMLSMI
jgi:hypothetical protein